MKRRPVEAGAATTQFRRAQAVRRTCLEMVQFTGLDRRIRKALQRRINVPTQAITPMSATTSSAARVVQSDSRRCDVVTSLR